MTGARGALMFIAALGGCATLPEGSRAPSLDPLLSFADPALCEPGPAFSAFLGGMTKGDANDGFRPGRIVAPPEISRHLGPVRVRKADGYWVASVAAAGRWMGTNGRRLLWRGMMENKHLYLFRTNRSGKLGLYV